MDEERLRLLIKSIDVKYGATTRLHVVLEDLNVEDEFIRRCMRNETLNSEEAECAELLLKIPEASRENIISAAQSDPFVKPADWFR